MQMRRTLTRLSLAAALAACAAAPALAGDFGYARAFPNGINPYGAATPVPAPIPVPVYEPEWYFRFDAAAGFGSQPSITTTGTPFGSGVAARAIGLDPAWLSEDFEPSFSGTVGLGYVWGASFRTDFTVDIHSIMDANFTGTQTYSDGVLNRTLTVQDKTRFMSTILLANAYYDIRTGSPFTPYVGGGLGFAVNQLTRSSASTDTGATGNFTVSDRTTRLKLAGAAMAGLTYECNSFVALDVGYRYLYIGGTDVDLVVNGVNTDLAVGNISEHQVRAGLRFYVD
jgi:opacity protein-like surface antigen